MRNFEDIARERIIAGMSEQIDEGAKGQPTEAIDPNDIEVFGSMVYALLRAGARREGLEGFQKAFEHFTQGAYSKPAKVGYTHDEELESMRKALIASVDRFSQEARALHVYFDAIDHNHATEAEATELAMKVLEGQAD